MDLDATRTLWTTTISILGDRGASEHLHATLSLSGPVRHGDKTSGEGSSASPSGPVGPGSARATMLQQSLLPGPDASPGLLARRPMRWPVEHGQRLRLGADESLGDSVATIVGLWKERHGRCLERGKTNAALGRPRRPAGLFWRPPRPAPRREKPSGNSEAVRMVQKISLGQFGMRLHVVPDYTMWLSVPETRLP